MTARRLWFRVDVLFFEETGDLSPAQQVALLKLIAYCKRRGGDGHIDTAALRREQVTPRTLDALISGEYVAENGTGWVIRSYEKWQDPGLSEKRSKAGRKGARTRWSKEDE